MNSWLFLPVPPLEILAIILNSAHLIITLSDLGVISKQLNDLIVLIVYHHVTVNTRVGACFQQTTPDGSAVQLGIVNYVYKQTRRVSIDRKLHWPSVVDLIYILNIFRELRYVTFTEVRALYDLTEAHKKRRRLARSSQEQRASVPSRASHTGSQLQTPSRVSIVVLPRVQASLRNGHF